MKNLPGLLSVVVLIGAGSLLAPACGSEDGSGFEEDAGSNGGASGASGTSGFSSGSNGGSGASNGGPLGDGAACEAISARAERPPLTLLMGLDQSCSMGDCGSNQRETRWVPVTTALTAFWNNPATAGISASLTLFPDGNSGGGGGGSSAYCEDSRYTSPDVPLTALPNAAPFLALPSFAPNYNPERRATPTRAVLRGLAGNANAVLTATPDAKVAVVLVTDGEPQSCGSADNLAEVQSAIEGQPFPTYVIAIAGLSGGYADEIAAAGGTSVADGGPGPFYVDANDPSATQAAFTAAMDQIRGALVPSCELLIPPPPAGQSFDKSKVNVTVSSGASSTELGYDPACAGPGWRYNDPNAPTHVVLCPQSCDPFKADPSAQLDVAFGCATRPADVN